MEGVVTSGGYLNFDTADNKSAVNTATPNMPVEAGYPEVEVGSGVSQIRDDVDAQRIVGPWKSR